MRSVIFVPNLFLPIELQRHALPPRTERAMLPCEETWLLIRMLLTRGVLSADPLLLHGQQSPVLGQNRHRGLRWGVSPVLPLLGSMARLHRSAGRRSLSPPSASAVWKALEKKAALSTQKEHEYSPKIMSDQVRTTDHAAL